MKAQIAANQEAQGKPFAVVLIFANGYKALSRHSTAFEAANVVVERLKVSRTLAIVRNGLTGERITRGEAMQIAAGAA